MNQSRMREMCKKYVFDYQMVVGRTYRKKRRCCIIVTPA